MKPITLKKAFSSYKQGDILEFVVKWYRHPTIGGYWLEDWRVVLDEWEFSDKGYNPGCEGKDRFSLDVVDFSGLTYHWNFAKNIPISKIKKSELISGEKEQYDKIMEDLRKGTHKYIR
jgi:hypothetical protein